MPTGNDYAAVAAVLPWSDLLTAVKMPDMPDIPGHCPTMSGSAERADPDRPDTCL